MEATCLLRTSLTGQPQNGAESFRLRAQLTSISKPSSRASAALSTSSNIGPTPHPAPEYFPTPSRKAWIPWHTSIGLQPQRCTLYFYDCAGLTTPLSCSSGYSSLRDSLLSGAIMKRSSRARTPKQLHVHPAHYACPDHHRLGWQYKHPVLWYSQMIAHLRLPNRHNPARKLQSEHSCCTLQLQEATGMV